MLYNIPLPDINAYHHADYTDHIVEEANQPGTSLRVNDISGLTRNEILLSDGFLEKIPDRLDVISMDEYMSALRFDRKANSPYLLKLKEGVQVSYNQTENVFQLNDYYGSSILDNIDDVSDNNIDDLDLLLYTMIFTLVANKYAGNFSKLILDPKSVKAYTRTYPVTVNIRSLLEAMGMNRGVNKTTVEKLIGNIKAFERVVGIIPAADGMPLDVSPALVWQGYNEMGRQKYISFDSPYLCRLIYRMMCTLCKKDPGGHYTLEDVSEWKPPRTGGNNRRTSNEAKGPINVRCYSSIVGAKSRDAAYITTLLSTTIVKAGNPRRGKEKAEAHISAYNIVYEKYPEFHASLKKNKYPNQSLKGVFSLVEKYLEDMTDIHTAYDGFGYDCWPIPTIATLKDTVYRFHHKGRAKDNNK